MELQHEMELQVEMAWGLWTGGAQREMAWGRGAA